MEVSSACSSFSSSWTMQGVTSNGILSLVGSGICEISPGLEPLVKETCSLKGDGVNEQGSCSTVTDISSTCHGRTLIHTLYSLQKFRKSHLGQFLLFFRLLGIDFSVVSRFLSKCLHHSSHYFRHLSTQLPHNLYLQPQC